MSESNREIDLAHINSTSSNFGCCTRIIYGNQIQNYIRGTTLNSEGFQNLPRDILVLIFSHFSEKEISQRLAPVCKNWRWASSHPTLWKKLDFCGNRVPTAAICRMLRNAPLLESIAFTRVPDILTIIRQLCWCNKILKILAVKFCTDQNGEVVPEEVLRNIISSCPNLSTLNLRGTQFFARRFCFELKHLQHLNSLDLSMNKFLDVHDLFVIVQYCSGLQELKISRRTNRREHLTDQDAVFLFDNIKKSIYSLKFDLKYLGPATIQAIFDCSRLTKLGLFNAYSLSGDLFRALGNYLPNLKHLKVCNACQLTSGDFCYLFTNHKTEMMKLIHLDVSGCWRLRDDGLKHVADTCSGNLQYLSIKSCKLITNVGVEYIINHCPSLKYLNVAHTVKLNESCLNTVPSALPQLQILIVDKSNARNKSLSALRSSVFHFHVKESMSEYTKQERVLL